MMPAQQHDRHLGSTRKDYYNCPVPACSAAHRFANVDGDRRFAHRPLLPECYGPMVVGSDAAHTPSRFSVLSSMPEATTSGGTHAKHAVSPGMTTLR